MKDLWTQSYEQALNNLGREPTDNEVALVFSDILTVLIEEEALRNEKIRQ